MGTSTWSTYIFQVRIFVLVCIYHWALCSYVTDTNLLLISEGIFKK